MLRLIAADLTDFVRSEELLLRIKHLFAECSEICKVFLDRRLAALGPSLQSLQHLRVLDVSEVDSQLGDRIKAPMQCLVEDRLILPEHGEDEQ